MFVSLFRSFAAANPAKPAVVCANASITYGQMELEVRRVSKSLALMEVEQGSRVVLALPNSIHTLVLYHALADCGAVIIPLSRDLTVEAIAHCVEDARPRFCLVSGGLALCYQKVCAALGVGQVVSECTRPYSLTEMVSRDPACIRPLPKILPDHELMIHYHWRPQRQSRSHWSGVVQTHRHLIQRLLSWSHSAGLGAADSTLCADALSDPLALETLALPALATGQTLHLMDPVAASPQRVVRRIRDHGIRVFGSRPDFYRQLLMGAAGSVGGDDTDLSSLRIALCDTAGLAGNPAPEFRRCFAASLNYAFSLPQTGLALVDFTGADCDGGIPIGQPIEGVRASLKHSESGWDGVGELYLRSEHFAQRNTARKALLDGLGGVATGILVRRHGGRFYRLDEWAPSGVHESPGVYLPA
ncbi:MAG: AMP-binding protein [Oleiphilaceae bacterium]|nr:AMP-binding protein [Oleiphilaceae bacterium]